MGPRNRRARSGTTFVGKMPSSAIRLGYLPEPFNPVCEMFGAKERLWREIGHASEIRDIMLISELKRARHRQWLVRDGIRIQNEARS